MGVEGGWSGDEMGRRLRARVCDLGVVENGVGRHRGGRHRGGRRLIEEEL